EKEEPEQLMQCPYDKNHMFRPGRFPYHIIKCRKNHPELASELKSCPFNARHLFLPNDMPKHIATCADRKSFCPDEQENADVQRKWQVPVSSWTSPPMSEDWDKEADNSAVPFVWGETPSTSLLPERNGLTNEQDVSSSIRAPNVFPWSTDED
ncbi:hypothetical protein CRUP_027649, partial [Coryphaenoides rupestris]